MNHQDYNISGSKYISVSCSHTIQGISIVGSLNSNISYNYSMIIAMYGIHISKIISINLIVELSLCHQGFWHSIKTQKCECYNINNIISCSGSNSTIKKGYWFGRIKRKPTVTACSNYYCDFTCCEITDGTYLSPARANQCRPHRTGIACGNCKNGYALSFDSVECIEVSKCKTGQTVMLITLSLLYWVVAVVAVFIMMYFKVTIGSLYIIVYYYSILDILLGQVFFISNRLYVTINIMSSLAKLTPQFLGKFCLIRCMSGIDQQFIHYVHPLAVSFILIMIIISARRSRRVSSFVSRGGIIHFICFLLLLSYTSIATTSLLLMRPLNFMDIDEVYTYLSPDIEYCYGRHLVYFIVAVISTVLIVIGLPLLLTLEPFLNSKINFIKIKPLLDQFQCCYKDKYHCFAGYYMICRLVIILVVIINIFNEFITTQYLLISSCAIMELIHLLVRPYASTFHNVFDGIILQLIVIISALPVVERVGSDNESLILVITYVLVIWPLASYITIKLWINKSNIQNAIKYLIKKCSHKYNVMHLDETNEPNEMNEFYIVIDDDMRRNVPTFQVDV